MREDPSMSQMIDIAKEEQFYNSIEDSDNLVDYFCVIGLEQQKI